MPKGIVYKSTGSQYLVKAKNDTFYDCSLKGKFRVHNIKSTNPVAVGDRIFFEILPQEPSRGLITEIYLRKNHLIRKSVKLSKQYHVLAANIDKAFLIVTLKNPVTFRAFIDRFLVTAKAWDIEAVLLINKTDIYTSDELAKMEELINLYRDIGYECLALSAVTNQGIAQLKELMKDGNNIFAGLSGVGKSTLINKLDPKLTIKTKSLSDQHKMGQHTTTFARMYDLEFGATITDTPGIKGFGVVDMDDDEIGDYFPEFFALKHLCKFNNCLHLNEPSCAIKKGVANGTLAQSRYKSYLQLLQGEESDFRLPPV